MTVVSSDDKISSMKELTIRMATADDVGGIRSVHRQSILDIAAKDYPSVQKIESKAEELSVKRLKLHSSISARMFYEKNGYSNLGKGTHAMRSGQLMECYLMEKTLGCT